MKKTGIGFTLVFCILLTSCSLPKEMIGPIFQPVDTILQGHGLVYFYKPWNFYTRSVEIKEGETKVATLCNETYYPLFQPVGEVTFWTRGEFKSTVTLNIEEGEEYYVYIYMLPGFLTPNPRLKIVTNEIGEKEIVKCKLGCPKWPEVQKELDKENDKNDNSTKNIEKPKIAAVVKVKEINSDASSLLEKDKEPIKLVMVDNRKYKKVTGNYGEYIDNSIERVENAFNSELRKNGYYIDRKAQIDFVVEIKQIDVNLAGGLGMPIIADISLFIKINKNNSTLVEKSLSEKFSKFIIQHNPSTSETEEAFQVCLDKIVKKAVEDPELIAGMYKP